MIRFFVFLTTLAGPASAQVYDCAITGKGPGGWMGDRIILAVDPKTGGGSALDAAINEIHQMPIPVDTERTKANKWVLRWEVFGVKSYNGNRETVSYRATLDTAARKVRIRGTLKGYDNEISGWGPCLVVK